MTHQCRMGWAGAAALVADELPGRPALRSPDPLRFSLEQMEARKALDVPPKEAGAPEASVPARAAQVFKAGDRVRGIGGCEPYWRDGDIGTVARFDYDGDPWVKWDGNTIGDGTWCAKPDHLEHIYQPSDTQQWVEWEGGDCPVPQGTRIEVRMREADHCSMRQGRHDFTQPECSAYWRHNGFGNDIVAFRVVQ